MVRVITINNFKGGVSKTSTTNGIAYILAEKMNKKVLVIDLDPQADATETLLLTYKKQVKNSL
ncbi:TPA: ParA family protein, partial [Staphylococcus aureus]|nr:ParA family protein [Staphylococcus aureus]